MAVDAVDAEFVDVKSMVERNGLLRSVTDIHHGGMTKKIEGHRRAEQRHHADGDSDLDFSVR